MIDSKFAEVKQKLQSLLEEASSVAITTDSAVIKHTGDSYVTVTGHWVTKEWKLMAAVLGVYICDKSHTGEEIFDLVQYVKKDFVLADRLDAITTDNGANFVKAALRDKQNDPSLHFNFEFESTVEDIETDNDQFITEYLHWGNTRRADLSPSDEQWEVAKQLSALLRPFAVVNDILQGEKYPTLGSVSRYISWLLQGLSQDTPPRDWHMKPLLWCQHDHVIQQVRSDILSDMQNHWDPSNPVYVMGSLTHPGHKSLSWLTAADKQDGISQLQTEMKNLAPSLVCDLLNIAVAETDDEVLHGQKKTKLSSVFEEAKLLFSFALPTPTQLFSNTVDDRVDEELKRYLAVPESDHLTGLDPLNWCIVDRGPTVGPTDGHGPGLFDLCTVAVRSRSGYLGLTAVHGPLKSSGPRQHCIVIYSQHP
eukprot:Em0002g597a